MKIFYININGLNEEKVISEDFIDNCKKSDILCFTETHLKPEADPPSIEGLYVIVRFTQ